MPVSRRQMLTLAAAALLPDTARAQENPFSQLERKSKGRLGVCVLDVQSGAFQGHRLDERFLMCSTFKLPLVACVLQRCDAGKLSLDAEIPIAARDRVPHAPLTEKHIGGSMSVAALCEAAQTHSDNIAANLLLDRIGGPRGFTQFFRAQGDSVTRLDRTEPALNDADGEHDTTSPRAMAQTLAKLLLGDALKPPSRDRLHAWLIATDTGARRIRAGIPATWRAGDKTGTARDAVDQINDVAIIWPPKKSPLIITAYYHATAADEGVLAEVGRIIAQ